MPKSQSDPVELIKRAALEAVQASGPVAVLFGTVVRRSPLNIQVEQKLTLGAKQLILLHGGATLLQMGDKVALLRVQGGKKFFVLGRLEAGA